LFFTFRPFHLFGWCGLHILLSNGRFYSPIPCDRVQHQKSDLTGGKKNRKVAYWHLTQFLKKNFLACLGNQVPPGKNIKIEQPIWPEKKIDRANRFRRR